jgi:hypothetical protein
MSGSGIEFAACSWGREGSDRLRRSVTRVLKDAGVSRSEWVERGFDVHHIVAAALEGAAPGRRVLARWSVDVHNIANGAIIPRSFHQGEGLHRIAFLDVVNRRLLSADMFAARLQAQAGTSAARLIIIKTLQKIGIELVLRSGDVLAFRLQTALQGEAESETERARSVVSTSRTRRSGRGDRVGLRATEGADLGDESVRAPRRLGLPLATAV